MAFVCGLVAGGAGLPRMETWKVCVVHLGRLRAYWRQGRLLISDGCKV